MIIYYYYSSFGYINDIPAIAASSSLLTNRSVGEITTLRTHEHEEAIQGEDTDLVMMLVASTYNVLAVCTK